MNVAHFASPIVEVSGGNSSSSDSQMDAAQSEKSDGESVANSTSSAGKVMFHAYMMNASNSQGDGSDGDDNSEEDNEPDGDDVESYQYGPDKIMECTVCKAMVRKDLYPYCHSYRVTSGDDSECGAHA